MSNTNEGQETTPEQPLESTQSTTQDINHIVTQEDVNLNPGKELVLEEEIDTPAHSIADSTSTEPTSEFVDLTQKTVPVADIELSLPFVEALHALKAKLPADHTLNVMADGYPNIEVISFDSSIPNSPRHIESLRAILVRNDNAYGVHKRYTGTEEELIAQFEKL